MGIRDVITHCLTGKDNSTYNLLRVSGASAFVVGMGLEIWSVANGALFDITNFGAGVGVLLGGIGAGLGVSAHTEPGHTSE